MNREKSEVVPSSFVADRKLASSRPPIAERLENRQLFAADPSGSPDFTFDNDGHKEATFGLGSTEFTSAATTADGKTLAAGWTLGSQASGYDFVIARYNLNGSLDTTFGSGTGRVITNFGRDEYRPKIVIQTDNKIVLVGQTANSSVSNIAVARYTSSGSLDTTFSGDGKMEVTYTGGVTPSGVALQTDGKIVISATVGTSGAKLGLVRLTSAGTLDTTFASGTGRVKDTFNRGTDNFKVTDLAITTAGKIVVTGAYDTGTGNAYDAFVARYSTSGSRDTTFGGGDGWARVNIGRGYDLANAIAIDKNDKLVIGGRSSPSKGSESAHYFVARFSAAGTLDTSFSDDGFYENYAPVIGTYASIEDLAVQPSGHIIAVGTSIDYEEGHAVLVIYRLTPQGYSDTNWAVYGSSAWSFADGANALTTGLTGKVTAVGKKGGQGVLMRFGTDNTPNARISGTVYNDTNGNGVKDGSEVGLSGWRVFADTNNDGFYNVGEFTDVTDSTGYYQITGLLPGTYRIREVRPGRWVRTQPAGAYPLGYYDVTLGTGQSVIGKHFGNKPE